MCVISELIEDSNWGLSGALASVSCSVGRYILHSPHAVMVLAHLSVAALTPRLPAESTGLCLAHCILLSKTGNSKAFKTA